MKKRCMVLWVVVLLPLMAVSFAQTKPSKGNAVRVALIKMPYVGERNVPDTSRGPDYLEQGAIQKLLEDQGVQTKPVSNTALTTDEEKVYGSWHKLAPARGECFFPRVDFFFFPFFISGLLAKHTSALPSHLKLLFPLFL